jgi:xanthine/CO dehydrogenase XdhC/CoxF family maturation factor
MSLIIGFLPFAGMVPREAPRAPSGTHSLCQPDGARLSLRTGGCGEAAVLRRVSEGWSCTDHYCERLSRQKIQRNTCASLEQLFLRSGRGTLLASLPGASEKQNARLIFTSTVSARSQPAAFRPSSTRWSIDAGWTMQIGRQAELIFTCLRCEANYNVDKPTTECPVCSWGRKVKVTPPKVTGSIPHE